MAILPKSGVSYINHVRPSELRTAIADLGLAPLDSDIERTVRFQLNRAIGSWWGQLKTQDSATAKKVFARQHAIYQELLDVPANASAADHHPESEDRSATDAATVVTVEQVASLLTQLANRLQAIDDALALPKSGFWKALDFRKLEAIGYIVASLDADVGGRDSYPGAAAHAFLADFRERARVVARACRQAQTKVDMHRGKPGPAPYDWFDPVTSAIMLICKRNGIKTTISTDRISNEKGGRFVLVTERIVQLLPKAMRPSTRDAIDKRLDRLEIEITTALGRLEVLRQAILKKAFSGQLVAQDPNDEPATALLERIRDEKEANNKKTKRKIAA